jgi:hypothetical protein
MAEKLADSIRRKVKGLQKILDRGPSKEQPGGSGTSAKVADQADPAESAAKPAAKAEKKTKPQPWYRHRQRW